MRDKVAIILASLLSFCLAVFKFIFGLLTSSILLISSAVDSLFDSLISVLNLFVLKKSAQAPNEKFNFGYSKLISLAAFSQGLFIGSIGLFLLYQSCIKFFQNDVNLVIENAIFVMIVALCVTGLIIFILTFAFKNSQNLVLKSDLAHYKSDFISNFAILIAFLLIKFTQILILDAVFGVLASFYIVYIAYDLIRQSAYVLLDGSIDNSIILEIANMILSQDDVVSFHDLRSRQSGDNCFLSYHIVFKNGITLEHAHQISDKIESNIKEIFPFKWNIDSHFDYFDDRGKN